MLARRRRPARLPEYQPMAEKENKPRKRCESSGLLPSDGDGETRSATTGQHGRQALNPLCADISRTDASPTKSFTVMAGCKTAPATGLCDADRPRGLPTDFYDADRPRGVPAGELPPTRCRRVSRPSVPCSPFVLLSILFVLSLFLVAVESCNESICASIVSKCTLLRSCDCDIEPTGCSCCKKCFACLDFLQVECCSCVGLCPMPNATQTVGAPQKSVVADFEESVPQLWEALTDGEDLQGRWQKYTYPVDVKPQTPAKKEEADSSAIQETVLKPESTTRDCSVVFLSQCMAEKKCEISCRSMGASAYRWFTDGCCECVGHGCVSYGINESRCEMCSYDDDDDDQLLPDNISDEELERLEKLENVFGAPAEAADEANPEPPPNRSGAKKSGGVRQN